MEIGEVGVLKIRVQIIASYSPSPPPQYKKSLPYSGKHTPLHSGLRTRIRIIFRIRIHKTFDDMDPDNIKLKKAELCRRCKENNQMKK